MILRALFPIVGAAVPRDLNQILQFSFPGILRFPDGMRTLLLSTDRPAPNRKKYKKAPFDQAPFSMLLEISTLKVYDTFFYCNAVMGTWPA